MFGRLYYHLNRKYGYKDDQGGSVNLFCMQVANLRHAIQFPLRASVAADLRDQRNQFPWTPWLSIIATVLSVRAFGISIFEKR